jgi:hypothetical protein
MRLSTALPIFAVAFAAACDSSTAPDRTGSDGLKPAFTPGAIITECVGALPPGTYQSIVVPVNAVCVISNSEIKRNITVLENSSLGMTGGTIVRGSILADKSQAVAITNSGVTDGNIVKHNIELRELTARVFICGTTVTHGDMHISSGTGQISLGGTTCNQGFGGGNILKKGSLTVEDNLVTTAIEVGLVIASTQVARNLGVFRNRGPSEKHVGGNTVGRALSCFENEEPFHGGGFALPNIAENFEGQCFR